MPPNKKRIVLRFSDAGANTIREHKALIDKHGCCWWGWWKKRHELFPKERIRSARVSAESGNLIIGLVDRKSTPNRFFWAKCNSIEFSDENIYAPDRSLVPPYYADERLNVWFRITNIVELELSDYIDMFGRPPTLDATLYEAKRSGDKYILFPKTSWEIRKSEAVGSSVLHISDLHFGSGHGYPLASDRAGSRVDTRPLAERIVEIVDRRARSQVGAIVVSGDLISRGDANSYPYVHAFLEELISGIGVEKESLVVVPGNHDMWTEGVANPTVDYSHEFPFRSFINGLFGRAEQDYPLEYIKSFSFKSGINVIFIGLNSARLRSNSLRDYGYIASHRYLEMLDYLNGTLEADPGRGKTVLIGVMHHHLMPVQLIEEPDGKRPVSMTLDAGEIVANFCKNQIGYVMHGHQHGAFVGHVNFISSCPNSSTNRGLYVFGAGSAGLDALTLASGTLQKNSISLYEFNNEEVLIDIYKYSLREEFSLFWQGAVPLLFR